MRFPRLSLLFLAGLALAGCGGSGGGNGGGQDQPGSAPLPGIYVHATNGNDTTGDGSPNNPYKTIRKALTQAGIGDTVRVGPGTYDAANGEFFPIIPGFGVTIVGTEIHTVFNTIRRTNIVGGGFWSGDVVEHRLHATIVPNSDNRLFGLRITNPQPFVVGGAKPAAVLMAISGTVVESCSLYDSDKGVRMVEGVQNTLIKDCAFVGNGIGIFVDGAGAGNRVEGTLCKDNGAGVMLFTEGADFGGGAAGSIGGNAFTQNAGNDFVRFTADGDPVFAMNCRWDHVPPTLSVGNPPSLADADVWEGAGGIVVTTGATLYTSDSPFPDDPILSGP